MQVLLLNDFASVHGGSDLVAFAEARGLSERGHQVTLWTAVGPVGAGLDGVPGLEVCCLGGADILKDPRRLRAMSRGIWNRDAAAGLAAWLAGRDTRNWVAHVHGWSKGLSAAIFPVLRRAGLNPVITMHDYFVACPNGTFHDHQRNQSCSRRPLGVACLATHCDSRAYSHKLWRVLRHAVQKLPGGVPGRVQHLISLSVHSEQVLRPHLPPGVKIHRLGNPVDIGRRAPVAVERNRAITYIGRLSREKGVLDLASAAGSGLEGGGSLVFAGDGELQPELQRLAPGATFTGWLDRPGIQAVLDRARVVVCPSVCHETYGLTAAEARARGVPVVVSDQCATSEQVRDGVDGWHFRQGDPARLRAVLEKTGDDTLVARFGRAAYDGYWSSPPDLSRHVMGLEGIYAEVQAGKSGR